MREKDEATVASEKALIERLKLGILILGHTIIVVVAFVKIIVDMDYSKADRAAIRIEQKEIRQEMRDSAKENANQHKEIMERLQHHMEGQNK